MLFLSLLANSCLVSAGPGSRVDAVESQNKFVGVAGDVGLGVAQ